MRPSNHELSQRADLDSSMSKCAKELSESSLRWLARNEGLATLLHTLSEKTPMPVKGLFARVHKKSQQGVISDGKKGPQTKRGAEFEDDIEAKKRRKEASAAKARS